MMAKSVRKRSFEKAAHQPAKGTVLGYGRVSARGKTWHSNVPPCAPQDAAGSSRRKPPAADGTVRSCTACSITSALATWWWSGSSTGFPAH